MNISINAAVQCVDGPNGHVECVVVDPISQHMTHIVVREGGTIGEAVMVPSEFVTRCSASTLHLQITAVQLQGMQVYVEDNYGRKNLEPAFIAGYGIYSMSGVAYWPNSRAAEKSQL